MGYNSHFADRFDYINRTNLKESKTDKEERDIQI